MPPMAKLAPVIPPCAFKPAREGRERETIRRLASVPRPKIGGLAEFQRRTRAKRAPEGYREIPPGRWRMSASFCRFRIHHAPPSRPLPVGSHATPTRGLYRLLTECSRALCVALHTRWQSAAAGCARAEIEVSEHGRCALRPWIAAVVITQAERQCEVLSCFPGVLHEQPESPGGGIPVPNCWVPVSGLYMTPFSLVGAS